MRTAILFAALATLIGCSSTGALRETDEHADKTAGEAAEIAKMARDGKTGAERSGVRVHDDGHYMPLREVSRARPQETPIKCSIEYNPVTPASLQEIGQSISEACKVSVRITPDAMAAVQRLAGSAGQGGGAQGPSVSTGDRYAPGLPSLPSLPQMYGGNAPVDQITISWSGPISGLLDAVTARMGLSWRHRDGVISIFHLDTRFFRINAIPSSAEMTSVVLSGAQTKSGATGEGTASVTGTSGSNQLTSVELKTDFMKDLETSVKTMLTPDIGRMALSRSSGTLTVTDTQETLDRVEQYINQINGIATKQVLLNVKILSVTLSNDDEYGINWDAVYSRLDEFGLSLKNTVASTMDAVAGSISILNGTGNPFAGTEMLINALSKQGKVTVLTQPSVTTLNMEPVPVQVARQVSYLESVELGQTAQVGSTTSLKPGSVTTGFNMMLLPHILDDSETVLLQYAMNLSSLDNLRTVSSGGSTIEIPEIDNRIFNQKVRLRTRETLVISGFEQTRSDSRRQGVGKAGFWGAGGGRFGKQRRDVIVMLITPIVQD